MGNGKYFYFRMKDDFFESDRIISLEGMENGAELVILLLKMYCRCLSHDGKLEVYDGVPFTPETLARVTRTGITVVEQAMQVFQKFGLIALIPETGDIFLPDIPLLTGESSTEADRKRLYDREIKAAREAAAEISPEISPKNLRENSKNSPTEYKADRPDKERDCIPAKPDTQAELLEESLPDYSPPAKPKGKKFIPPTAEEVEAFCTAKGMNIDAARFVDYYTSVGWRIGKNQIQMRDWHAAARNWCRRTENGIGCSTQPTKPRPAASMVDEYEIGFSNGKVKF